MLSTWLLLLLLLWLQLLQAGHEAVIHTMSCRQTAMIVQQLQLTINRSTTHTLPACNRQTRLRLAAAGHLPHSCWCASACSSCLSDPSGAQSLHLCLHAC
jgi:hypothetical protein